MITLDEIQRSLTAVWYIFLGRADAIRSLDVSDGGFWRSFQAILLVAPLYALASAADWQIISAAPDPLTGTTLPSGAFIASRAVTLALDWITLPILLALLSGFLGIRQSYATFIVARNWSVPIAFTPFAGLAILEQLGIITGDYAVIPSLLALAFSLRLAFMVVRTGLNVPSVMAVGYVVLDFLVSLALARVVTAAFGIPMR